MILPWPGKILTVKGKRKNRGLLFDLTLIPYTLAFHSLHLHLLPLPSLFPPLSSSLLPLLFHLAILPLKHRLNCMRDLITNGTRRAREQERQSRVRVSLGSLTSFLSLSLSLFLCFSLPWFLSFIPLPLINGRAKYASERVEGDEAEGKKYYSVSAMNSSVYFFMHSTKHIHTYTIVHKTQTRGCRVH